MVYVGIDLQRKWSQLAAVDAAGEPRLNRRIPSRPEEFYRVFGVAEAHQLEFLSGQRVEWMDHPDSSRSLPTSCS